MFYLTLEKIFKIYVGLGTQDYYTAYIRLKMKKKYIAIIKIDYLKYFFTSNTTVLSNYNFFWLSVHCAAIGIVDTEVILCFVSVSKLLILIQITFLDWSF